MSRIRIVIAVSIVFFTTSIAFAQIGGGDLPKMQGPWWRKTQVASLVKSKTPSKPLYSITVLVVEGNKIQTVLATPDAKVRKFEYGFALNESTNPKQFDSTEDSPLGKMLAIYEIDGDTLKICTGGPGDPRPTRFVGSSDPLSFPQLAAYTRGLPPGGMPGPKEVAKSRFPAQFKARATILRVDPNQDVLLRFEDGRELLALAQIGKAFDASGARIKDAHSVKQVGNVLDVFLTGKMIDGKESYHFIEARLVTGELAMKAAPALARAAARPALDLQTGVVKEITKWRVTIDLGGTLVHIGRHHPAAKAYDINGTLMPKGSAERMLQVGNKVAVFVNPKSPRQVYPGLREIQLIEGTMADPPPQ